MGGKKVHQVGTREESSIEFATQIDWNESKKRLIQKHLNQMNCKLFAASTKTFKQVLSKRSTSFWLLAYAQLKITLWVENENLDEKKCCPS